MDAHWQRLMTGDSGARPVEDDLAHVLPGILHAPTIGTPANQVIHNRMLRKLLLPSASFAVDAAGQAIRDAGLAPAHMNECGLFFGSVAYEVPGRTFEPAIKASFGPDGAFDFARFGNVGMELVDPLLIVKGLPNAAPCGVSIEHGIRGINVSITSGQTSGLQAVVAAYDAIRDGLIDYAVVGGSDSMLLSEHQLSHHVAGRLRRGHGADAIAARPFDRDRDGYVLGEGAAACVLEAEDHARARGARILAAIAGADDVTWTAASPDIDGRGLVAAAGAVMAHVTVTPRISVFATGLGTRGDDLREARAITRLFGRAATVVVTAATGALGMTGAASGAFAFVHGIRAMHTRRLPPLTGCREVDPECGIQAAHAGDESPETALAWSTDGARNVVVAIERCA
jgi:3-oxoacyl-[acyl-carrier-protein] synthase II